jgi:DNA-directed RNA polymerase alpha subunit
VNIINQEGLEKLIARIAEQKIAEMVDDAKVINDRVQIKSNELLRDVASVRLANALSRVGVRTVKQLSEWTEPELIKLKNFGRECNIERMKILENFGYR